MPTDPLTGLPDRIEFRTLLDHCVDAEEGLLALIIVNVRRVRDINIQLGYPAGDALLAQVAERIRGCLRPSDIVARIGAAEFALLLPGLKSQAQPLMAVSKVQRVFGEPLEMQRRVFKVQLSFGVSLCPMDAKGAEGLLRCADLALDHARKTRKDSVLYSECADREFPPLIELERELETAIKRGELEARYQPKIDLVEGKVTGVEALARWTSEEHGQVSPDVFVHIAERSGLIMPLTRSILNTALCECREWRSLVPDMSVSVNLTPTVLSELDFPELVMHALKTWDARDGQLTLEVTESVMMANLHTCLGILGQLRDMGVTISIDDFGTGFSSLAYLKELPVSELKIDKSFVMKMIENEADKRIVQAVIDLAHNFDLKVVAEGVEDEETLDTLTLMGCEAAQGWFVGQPMLSEDFVRWVHESPWGKDDGLPLQTFAG